MKFMNLGKKERHLFLNILDFDLADIKCQQCNDKLNYENCSIMPPVNTKLKATLLCGSPLCYAEYFSLLEEEREGV